MRYGTTNRQRRVTEGDPCRMNGCRGSRLTGQDDETGGGN
jgi:hypothetical protein